MEAYRLNSKLVENNKEYYIKTTNDVSLGTVSSEVFINGALADTIMFPHPEQIQPEEVLSLVKNTHDRKKKEVETLLEAFQKTLDSSNAEQMLHLGLAFYYKRFFNEAKELFRGAIEINSDYHEAYNHLGQTELSLGNVHDAVEAAQTAVEFRPEYADYRNNLGEAFLAAKMYKQAALEFDRAININLYYSDAYFNYGLVLLLNALEKENMELFANFLSKSQDYFYKAQLIYPDYKTALFEKGLEALKEHDLKKGFRLLKQVCEEKKEHHRHKYAPYYMKYALHPNWVSEQAVEERIVFLQTEISKNPTYVDLYAELARCYLLQSRMLWKKGIEQYKKALELNPTLEQVEKNTGKANEVLDLINQVVKKILEQG